MQTCPHLRLKGVIVVAHAEDPVCHLAENLAGLVVLAPKHELDGLLGIREGKAVLDEEAGAAALLGCGK